MTISGAMYSGVPQTVNVRCGDAVSPPTNAQSPKSTSCKGHAATTVRCIARSASATNAAPDLHAAVDGVEHEVLGLNIAMEHVSQVERLEREREVRSDEPGLVFSAPRTRAARGRRGDVGARSWQHGARRVAAHLTLKSVWMLQPTTCSMTTSVASSVSMVSMTRATYGHAMAAPMSHSSRSAATTEA